MYNSKKVNVIGGGKHAMLWLEPYGYTYTDDLAEADLAILTGGEDINPEIYGERCSKTTYFRRSRDEYEINVINYCFDRGIPLFGICRGAQLLTAMVGGRLIQDVDNHSYCGHNIKTVDDEILLTNSLHHQMMYPFVLPKDSYEIIAYSHPAKSKYYINGLDDDEKQILPEGFVEPEIVLYKRPFNLLAVQGHPEMSSMPTKTIDYIEKLIKDLLIDGKTYESIFNKERSKLVG